MIAKIKDIRDRCPPHASYRTKFNALESLREFGENICTSDPSELVREARQSFGRKTILEEAMIGILQAMNQEEWDCVLEEHLEDVAWTYKVDELADLAADYCIFPRMKAVLQLFSDDHGYDGGDDDGGDDKEESTNANRSQPEIIDMNTP